MLVLIMPLCMPITPSTAALQLLSVPQAESQGSNMVLQVKHVIWPLYMSPNAREQIQAGPTCRLLLNAEVLLPPVSACMCSISRPPSERLAVLPLMPLVISRAGSTISMASMPVITRFMVRSVHSRAQLRA